MTQSSISRKGFIPFLAETWKSRYVYWNLLLVEIRFRYKKSYFGILWHFLSPLAIMVFFWFAFKKVFVVDIENYPVFLLIGIIAFRFFDGSVQGSIPSFLHQANMLKKFRFSKVVIPLIPMGVNMVQFLFGMAVVIPLAIYTYRPEHIFSLIWLFPLLACNIAVIAGLSLIASLAYIRVRDVSEAVTLFMFLLFYMCPIFYSEGMVPERFLTLYKLNPLASLIIGYREALQGSSAMPSMETILIPGVEGLLLLSAGLWAVYRNESWLVKRI